MSKADITIDFDHHSTFYRDNWAELAEERVARYPLAWTEAHGGFWILSGYNDIAEAIWDTERFSSAHNDPDKPWAKGILIPELPYTLALSESDPPIHTARRAIEAPYFSPKMLREIQPLIEKHIDEALSDFIGEGQADLATEFAMRVAAQNTIALVGIDTSLWREFMLSAHQATLLPSTHPDYPLKEIQFVQAKLRELLVARAGCPQAGILTALATAKIAGEPLPLETQVGMVSAAIFGGFGTVMSTTLSAVRWLEQHPECHEELLEDDALMDRLIHETLRVFPPNHGTARTVAVDCELRGQQLKQGERVLFSWAAANRDPTKFSNPSKFDLTRTNSHEHFSFSGGHHRCLGAALARLEIRHLLRALLRYVPDFRIDHERLAFYPSFANNAGIVSMPVSFTPGRQT
jgi:cytochrome P450